MFKQNRRQIYEQGSDEQIEGSESESGRKEVEHESEFHTFAASKGREVERRGRSISSQEEQEEDSSMEYEKRGSPDPDSVSISDASNDEHNKKEEQESFVELQARIKKLQNQLSKKLKKISPEREIDRPNGDVSKKHLRPKYTDIIDNAVIKQNPKKKESISPRTKKTKSKEIKSNMTIGGSTSTSQNKPQSKQTKRVNETQLRTIQQGKPNKVSTRKLTQSHQGNFKEHSQKQTIQDLRKQNQLLKSKLPSKSKKKSIVEKQIQDMDYLKSKINSSSMTKLEKEIELLKIVEAIRVKLKRSINHKLSRMYPQDERTGNKGKITTFLLHRGCPANYLN